MSKRAWRKFKDEKARRKAERKAEIRRANTPAVGPAKGPWGYETVEVRCPECDYPATELLAVSNGQLACARCTENPADVLFAIVRERRGDDVVTHMTKPSF